MEGTEAGSGGEVSDRDGAWLRVLDSEGLSHLRAARVPMQAVDVGHPPRRVLLACVGQDVVALDARCGHRGGPLELGDLEDVPGGAAGGAVRCPWHGRVYCLGTGRELFGGGRPASVPAQRPHTLEERADGVYLRLPLGQPAPGDGSCEGPSYPSDEFALEAESTASEPHRGPKPRSTLEALLAAGAAPKPKPKVAPAAHELAKATGDDTAAGVDGMPQSSGGSVAATSRQDFVSDEFLF